MGDNYVTWRDELLYDSELFLEDLTSSQLDDTFGWGARYDAYLNDREQLTGSGLLITGPDGCGKHTAALHMINRLVLQKYGIVFLDGSQFTGLDFSDVYARMESLLGFFIAQKKALCICLEGMEDHALRRELLRYLGHTLTVYCREKKTFPSLFLILIDRDAESVPFLLRRRLLLCRMVLPDKTLRKKFLEAKASFLGERIPLKLVAEHTEGASYLQILDTLDNLAYLVDSKEGVEEKEMIAFIAGQRQPVEDLRNLSDMMKDFLEQLPELLKNAGGGSSDYSEKKKSKQQNENGKDPRDNEKQYLSDMRRETENMDPKELASLNFGEEGAIKLNEKIKEKYNLAS